MKHLFYDFFYSITEPKSYRGIIDKSITQCLAYFLFYFGIFILLSAAYISLFVSPVAISQVSDMFQDLSDGFPPSVQVEVQNHLLKLSGSDQVVIPLTNQSEDQISNLLIIDPTTDVDSINQMGTIILMTDEALSFITDTTTNEFQIIPWDQLDLDFTLNQQSLEQISSFGHDILSYIQTYTFPLSILAGLVILIPSRLAFVAIYTIFFSLTGNLSRRNYGYGTFFKIGLHTVVIAQIIDMLQRLIYPQPWPMLFSVAYIGITTIALLSLRPLPKVLKS